MARRSATAARLLLLAVLVLSLLAVAHCRTLAADHAADPEPAAAVAAVSDENGLRLANSNPTTLPADDEEQQQQHGLEFLRLPSHRLHGRHRPCGRHCRLRWKRHHGADDGDLVAGRRFHYSGNGVWREAASHLAILRPAEEASEAEEVKKPVAEPDPDRSLPESGGELVVTGEPSSSFADADGHDGERAAVRAWKKEMLRRWIHFHIHHGMRRHHRPHHVHHDDDGEEEEEEAAPEGMNMKRFHFHRHDEDDEEKNTVTKRLRHEHDEDSDDEEDERQVEEMVRRFRKAIMRRRRFGHGHGRRFFHHFHRHAEEQAKKQQADGEEESGVMAWIKGLMNRF